MAILPHQECTPFWNSFQTRNLQAHPPGPFWNVACTMPQVSICLWPAFDLSPSLAEHSHSAEAHSGRRRSSKSCSNPIKVRHSEKHSHCQPFTRAALSAWHGVVLPNESTQFRANLRWILLRECRLVPIAHFPTPPYNPGRWIRCTCLLATSNGSGEKTRALPGNCCRRRKVRIRIRARMPGRYWPVPVFSAAQD